MKRIAALLMWMLLCSGCALTSNFAPPKFEIVSVAMISGDVFSQQFRIRLHVQNPNNLEMAVKKIEYKLYLQGDSFAEGTSEQPFVVPASGETEFDMAMSTNFVSSLVRVLGTLNDSPDNKMQYKFAGKVYLSKGVVKTIPFNEVGSVVLNKK